ncbi:hypothetical protein P368_15770 [Comamonas thiooxydans]|nr:hypothetical protein P365_19775 [Comamonas thiooxydans]KGH10464.1 hypothetical protein P368_15770 [Comamonas thiooxydans]
MEKGLYKLVHRVSGGKARSSESCRPKKKPKLQKRKLGMIGEKLLLKAK